MRFFIVYEIHLSFRDEYLMMKVEKELIHPASLNSFSKSAFVRYYELNGDPDCSATRKLNGKLKMKQKGKESDEEQTVHVTCPFDNFIPATREEQLNQMKTTHASTSYY